MAAGSPLPGSPSTAFTTLAFTTPEAEHLADRPGVAAGGHLGIAVLAADAEDLGRRHRDLRDQRRVGHAEVRVRVLWSHTALVAEEDPRLRPRHLLAER